MSSKKIIPLFLFSYISLFANAQSGKDFTGIWEGKLNAGIEIRIVFHISENGTEGIKSTMDSPDQSAYGLKCDTAFIAGDLLTIEMKDLQANFSGKLTNDKTIRGTFTQRAKLPLILYKVEKVAERNRPQTPRPPFPYKSEEIVYENSKTSLRYGATITIPEGTGPFPAAVLITGSGAQNRDEELFGHKMFAVIADELTRKGFVILRVDDRGMGKSTGLFNMATSADFAADVNASTDYLLSRPEVDKSKVGLIGHSEGGMIAPIVATERTDINFIILLAGPGVKITDLMTEQTTAIIRSSGASEKAVNAYKPLYTDLVGKILNTPDTASALVLVKNTINDWAANTSNSVLRELGLKEEKERNEMAATLVRSMASKWFTFFLRFDPQTYLEKLSCKVLALNGSKDIQVIASQNLPGIEASLKKSKAVAIEIKELPGLNHLFQSCKKCTVNEYNELEETISPAALQAMSDWLLKNVK